MSETCQRFPCPHCSEETPWARCYQVDKSDDTFWCPTGHHYVELWEVEHD